MSKGPGRVERSIVAALTAEPHNAFTILDLVDRIYVDVHGDFDAKKYRVAVARAMRTAVARSNGELAIFKWSNIPAIYWTYDVLSYAMARLKSDPLEGYHAYNKYLDAADRGWRQPTETMLQAQLAPGGREHHLVVKGGSWHNHVMQARAIRDGDTATAAAYQAEQERSLAAISARLKDAGA